MKNQRRLCSNRLIGTHKSSRWARVTGDAYLVGIEPRKNQWENTDGFDYAAGNNPHRAMVIGWGTPGISFHLGMCME